MNSADRKKSEMEELKKSKEDHTKPEVDEQAKGENGGKKEEPGVLPQNKDAEAEVSPPEQPPGNKEDPLDDQIDSTVKKDDGPDFDKMDAQELLI